MIVFVGAVRHPLNSNNYAEVERLLRDTLLSICNQVDRNFKIVIVCNQLPLFEHETFSPFVEFVKVDFPPPSDLRTAHTGMGPIRKDRASKYIIGIIAAQKHLPDYIMIFDVDDYLSAKIGQFVNASPKTVNGWYIMNGYVMDHATQGLIWPIEYFYLFCGSSLIINNELLINPPSTGMHTITSDRGELVQINRSNTRFIDRIKINSSLEDIMQLDYGFLHYILGSHRWVADYYQLCPLPFYGAIWNWNTGENHGNFRVADPRTVAASIKDADFSEFIPETVVTPRKL
jgi:hypothetical protein